MPKPICFMVMPYGKRATGVSQGAGPDQVDFDRLWEKAYSPVLEELGYEPVRADQDLGALIIKEMIERLAIADLVVADVTLPNANVYYEVGVRHAAKETGCVMLAASWSRQLFDIAQMPQLRYELSDGQVKDEAAAAIRSLLKDKLLKFASGQSPVFQSVPGYPGEIDETHATSFREFASHLSKFQGRIKAIRSYPREKRRQQALALLDEYPPTQPTVSPIAIEILYTLRDCAGWEAVLDYYGGLSKDLQDMPFVQEQYYLALSKAGNPEDSIQALLALIEQFGDSSERRGLLGGRFKNLYKQAEDQADRTYYLDLAIEHYEKGMMLDLNDYYPTCNLPRLYRARGGEGDEERARRAAMVALAACERSLAQNPDDPWVRPTLLGAAFDTGNINEARRRLAEVRRGRPSIWQLKSTLSDLRISIELQEDPALRRALEEVLHALEVLVE